MVSSAVRISLRLSFTVLLIVVAFYVGRPLYWKLFATIHDIREKRQTVKQESVHNWWAYIVQRRKGNVFTFPSNEYAEFNMFLDPVAAKAVVESDLDITLIPLNAQRKVTSFPMILKNSELTHMTPEAVFAHRLLSLLHKLQQKHRLYQHMDTFFVEILGVVFLASQLHLNPVMQGKPVTVLAGNITTD